MVLTKYGVEKWEAILQFSKLQVEKGEFFHSIDFPDSTVRTLVESASKVLGVAERDLMNSFGTHFMHYMLKYGFEKVLLCSSKTMREWLHNIGEPHRLMRIKFPTANLPDFRVETQAESPDELLLHYYTTRNSYWEPLVEGLCCSVAKKYFDREIGITRVISEEVDAVYHACWKISNLELETKVQDPRKERDHINMGDLVSPPQCPFSLAMKEKNNSLRGCNNSVVSQIHTEQDDIQIASKSIERGVGICSMHLKKIFPFHLSINQDFVIIQAGTKIEEMFTKHGVSLVGQKIQEIMEIAPEGYEWTWSQLVKLEGRIVSLVSFVTQPALRFSGDFIEQEDDYNGRTVTFLIRPDIYRISEMEALDLSFSDFPPHSFQRDIIIAGESLKQEIDNAKRMTEMSRELTKQSFVTKQALKTKQVFVRYVSHEIRTPLNIAALGLAYLDEKLDETEKAKHGINDTLEEIKLSCSIAVEILNDFLLYEKIDDGIFDLSLSRVFFAPIITESRRLFDVQAKSASISFDVDMEPIIEDVEVLVDRKKFYQVLRNLLSNAIKFTPTNGRVTLTATLVDNNSIRISSTNNNNPSEIISAQATEMSSWQLLDGEPIYFAKDIPMMKSKTNDSHDAGKPEADSSDSKLNVPQLQLQSLGQDSSPLAASPSVDTSPQMTSGLTMVYDSPSINTCVRFLRIVVSDTGAGISKQDQVALFHQFIQVQADKLQHGQGSGLGLWIAANIIRMHGGRIGVMSPGEGLGSKFIVDLPVFCPVYSMNPPTSDSLPMDVSISTKASAGTSPYISYGGKHVLDHMNMHRQPSHSSCLRPPHPPSSNQSDEIAYRGELHSIRETENKDAELEENELSSRLSISTVSDVGSTPSSTAFHHHPNSSKDHLNGTSQSKHKMVHSLHTTPSVSSIMSNCNTPRQQPISKRHLPSPYPGQPAMFLSSLSPSLIPLFEDESLWQPLRSLSLNNAKVLIVDDASSNRKMMRRILQDKFPDMDEAENGRVALDRYIASCSTDTDSKNRPYDIIFMDGIMPVMDGNVATREIRRFQFQQVEQHLAKFQTPIALGSSSSDSSSSASADDQIQSLGAASTSSSSLFTLPLLPRTLILGVTGNGQDEDMQRFVDAGADYVFVKPIHMPSLMEYLDMFFG